ncbi:MAG: TonB-dependent receptor [Proteobacteria bacterium]|nr:TonB-dependent receptor [Pseudomonadota bacterium]
MKSLRAGFRLVYTALLFAIAVPVALISTDAIAQEITASIQGTVLGPDGTAATGAIGTLTDGRDGRRQTASADARGIINFRSISSGGPYTLRISAPGAQNTVITDLYTDVAGTSSFTVTLETTSASIDEVVVTAAQIETVTTASGPSSTFSLEQITDMPSTTRQIRDIIRLDPKISIGQTGDGGDQSGAISCLGGSSRTNSFTIDGVRANDAFGLNLSGNLARFTFPIPFDSVAGAAVEFAPVSVEYGQFSGCNINVVTKSGENEFHGGGFYLYNDDSMTNDKVGDQKFDQGSFERENYGFEIGGPILKDRLFFYTSYENFETANVNPWGALDDSSFPRQATAPPPPTLAEVEQINSILSSQYGREAGPIVRNLPVTSERYFGRIDWNINDDHRFEATYASIEEATVIGDDIGTGRGAFTFADNFHARGSESETFGVRFYSDWTDRMSTELRWSTQEVVDAQNPVGGGEAQDAIPLPRIAISPFFASEFAGTSFVSGPGTFRSANKLTTDKDQLKLKLDYQLGDHLLTVGYETESVDIFNLFIINATGTVFFRDVANLQAGTAYDIISANSFTGVPDDAAAAFTRDIDSYYVQDTWNINDSMELIFGVRIDEYTSNDAPLLNQNYVNRYGMTNQVGFDGLDAVQPRIGFNWTLPEKFGDTRLSLGYGVFSGNDPTVWFSNAFQNFGGALGRATATGSAGCDGSELNVLAGGSFSGIPDCVLDAAQTQALNTAAAVNATDPNIELATVTRYSLGLEHNTAFESEFLSDWNVRFDLIYGDLNDQYDFLDLTLHQVGNAPDGRPIYDQVDPLLEGCAATFAGLRQGFDNVTAECYVGSVNQDVFLTNRPGSGGNTFTASIQLAKAFDYDNGWSLNLNGGYSYNESEVGNPGTSFTAAENFRAVVATDIVNVPVGPSLRNTPHNFVLNTTFSKEFWSGYKTSITAFMQYRAGSPVSVVYLGGPFAGAIGDTGGRARNLLYVPIDENDPLVNFGSGFDTDAFFSWVDKEDMKRGAIQKKGTLDEEWSSDLDIRFQQEIPFFGEAKAKFYLDIENVLNLLDTDYGRKRFIATQDIASAVGVVAAGIDIPTNTYNYTSFTAPVQVVDTWDSLYRIQLGIRVDF